MRFIVTADWHIRATRPLCRKDQDWFDTQRKALAQLESYAQQFNADVMVVGDIFNSNTDTNFECIKMVQDLADRLAENNLGLFVLAGNHDLPYHSSKNIGKSAIGVLLGSSNVHKISSYSKDFYALNFDESCGDDEKEFVFVHILAFKDKESMPPMITGGTTAEELCDKYPKAKWIFTGDNHHSFFTKVGKTNVVNPGCLIRQNASMKDYDCKVYLIDTDMGVASPLLIRDDVDLVDNSYITERNERNERIGDFVERLKENSEFTFDFVENIKEALAGVKEDGVVKCVERFVGI